MRIARRAIALLAGLLVAGAATGWALSAPERVDPARLATLAPGNAAHGETVFNAGGCASCHAGPNAEGEARLRLGGGTRLQTAFGTFVAPNISSSATDGIGNWSDADFVNALLAGVSPDGRHYYPAFPYTSYTRMSAQDAVDLHTYLKTLPAVSGKAAANEVPFPFNIRRGLGLWKRLYLHSDPVVAEASGPSPAVLRGRYLVEGPAHCGECHTPRDPFGGLELARWLAGAKAPEGEGRVPDITPSPDGLGAWSEGDIASLLETGFTPDFDSVGGSMADVVHNTSRLSAEDRAAIAAYLKTVPAQAQTETAPAP